MLLSEYVELTKILVANQSRLVEEAGYCIAWNGHMIHYGSVQPFVEEVHRQIAEEFADALEYDISVDEAMFRYGL